MSSALENALKLNQNVLLWGYPGAGKTKTVEALTKKLGYHTIVLIGSIREPSDFGGQPVLDNEGGFSLAPPGWVKEAWKKWNDERIITCVFCDELTSSPPAVQAAQLRMIQDNVVGDTPLPPFTRKVAAANPPEIAANGHELTPPLANRFKHIEYIIDNKDFIAKFPFNWDAPMECDEIEVGAQIQARSLIASYLQTSQHNILNFPKTELQQGRAWPSPRSWEMASKDLALAGEKYFEALEGMTGCVGAVATEFVTWLKSMDLPNPEDILKSPEKWAAKMPKRADILFATLSGVNAAVYSNTTKERWQKAWEVLSLTYKGGHPDVSTVWATTLSKLTKMKPDLKLPMPDELKVFGKILIELQVTGSVR